HDDDGVEKLRLVQRVLAHRRARPEAFDGAGYEPLDAPDDIVAFSRGEAATVVPRRSARPRDGPGELPPGRWRALATRAPLDGGRHAVGALLERFPVAVLAREVS